MKCPHCNCQLEKFHPSGSKIQYWNPPKDDVWLGFVSQAWQSKFPEKSLKYQLESCVELRETMNAHKLYFKEDDGTFTKYFPNPHVDSTLLNKIADLLEIIGSWPTK